MWVAGASGAVRRYAIPERPTMIRRDNGELLLSHLALARACYNVRIPQLDIAAVTRCLEADGALGGEEDDAWGVSEP